MAKSLGQIDHNHISLIAALDRSANFGQVARKLKTHTSTISRKMGRLEAIIGYRLVNRNKDGFTLTNAGRTLVPLALEHEKSATVFIEKAGLLSVENAQLIVVQVPEGLGSYWITPHFVKDSVSHDTHLSLICSDTLPILGEDEVDISVQYAPAMSQDHVQIVLGYLHMLPFASKTYVNKAGVPNTIADLPKHRLLAQVGPHDSNDLWAEAITEEQMDEINAAISIRTNSGSAHYSAIKSGYGIGALPSYAPSLDPELVMIDLGLVFSFPIYAVFEPGAKSKLRFRQTLTWLKATFSKEKYPFFGESFTGLNC